MLPQNNPDRIRILFDDHRLVANAGLLLPATLAQHLGLRELVDRHLDPGGAPGRANTGDKLLTLVASALAGGDCIDDADALRAGGTVGVLGCVVKAPSTPGTFLRSFRWGHVRQLDRVSRQLLARAWAAGAGPGDSPLTIDLDSTICETYGLAKEGARHHGYTGKRGYHPLLAIAAGTGDVLMSRLRQGRANTARGAAHFLRETVGRVRYGGASGRLTVRADSGFYTHALVAVCRRMGVRFSITIRQHKGLRELIEAIPEQDWTPIPYWMDGAADVADRRENIIAIGNSGTGKTHIALGLGLAACQKGMSVGFTTAAALVHELMEARDERRLLSLQRQLSRLSLLIIDELGFVPLSPTGAELLFEVFSQRYERGSILVTTNLPFDEWTEVFGSERLTGALLDRLTHHVHILEMNGESYRLKHSREGVASQSQDERHEE